MDKIKNKMSKKLLKEEAPLGTPFHTYNNPNKFVVHVKNKNGNPVTVRFGNPNIEIKQGDPERRNNLTAVSQITKECTDFTELDLSPFKGKPVLIETIDGSWYGTLGVFKDNIALFEGESVKKAIDPFEISKVICENTRILILEKNKPNDPKKWSACKSQAKSKFDVYPSAYANAWAAKCYKKKGGSWRSVKEEVSLEAELLNEVIKHRDGKWVVMNKDETKVLGTHPSKNKAVAQLQAIEANKSRHGMHEGTDLLLKDRLKQMFFEGGLTEEVVNKDHKGSMTKAEIEERDRVAAKLKKRGNIKRIKTSQRLDSQTEAEHRTATFIVLGKRKGKKSKSGKKSDK